MPLFIRAEAVQDCGAGIFRIEIKERTLTDKHRDVLEELFPNLAERVYHLLDAEAVLASLMSPEEANAHMARGADPIPVAKVSDKPRGKKHTPPPKLPGNAFNDDDDDDPYVGKDMPE